MEPETIFSIVIAALWLLSQLARARKGKPAEEERPPPVPRPKRAAASPSDVGAALARVEARFESGLPDLDANVRAMVLDLYQRELREEARNARESGNPRKIQDVVSRLEGIHGAGRMLSGARTASEHLSARRVADRLLEEIDAPLRDFARTALLELPLPPAVAVVRDPPRSGVEDRLGSSPLAASTIFVPSAVSYDPRHWSLVAHEVARYVGGLAPGIYPEIYDRLELDVSQADLATNREALMRLLFGSYLGRILGDAVGATLFGPAYLSALTSLYAEPASASRITTIYLNQDGTVYPEPPAHLRVHLTSEWLTQMGLASQVEALRRSWDERHGHPEQFAVYGSMGSIPSGSFLDAATNLMAQLYALELSSLGMRTLEALPGLSQSRAGRRTRGSARELIASAIAEAVETPEGAVEVARRLFDSFREVKVPALPSARAPFSATSRPLRASATEFAEALLLGEILLRPRGGAGSLSPRRRATALPVLRRTGE